MQTTKQTGQGAADGVSGVCIEKGAVKVKVEGKNYRSYKGEANMNRQEIMIEFLKHFNKATELQKQLNSARGRRALAFHRHNFEKKIFFHQSKMAELTEKMRILDLQEWQEQQERQQENG